MAAVYRPNYYEQELDEDLGEVDADIAIGNYGQSGGYDEGGHNLWWYLPRHY